MSPVEVCIHKLLFITFITIKRYPRCLVKYPAVSAFVHVFYKDFQTHLIYLHAFAQLVCGILVHVVGIPTELVVFRVHVWTEMRVGLCAELGVMFL